MEALRKLTTLLNKPFPEEESRFGNPKTALIISLFITFFLIIFQPFGISERGSDRYLVCLGFGAMTFFTSIIYEYVIGQILQLKGKGSQWTFLKWIINNLGLMFFISLANFLFARLAIFGDNIGDIHWELIPHMIYGTFMVGIIPVIGMGASALFLSERKHLKIAAEMNTKKIEFPNIEVTEETSVFDIPVSKIRYAEALQNYVKIGYLNNSGTIRTTTERTTLKHILEQTHSSSIVKSHRSFLVNRDTITSIEGNAQGLTLTLSDCDITIPVSRSFIKAFRST